VRHVRMLGLCLVAVFAVSAVFAASALAKDPYTSETWAQYKHCPYEIAEKVANCFYGRTSGGKEGGEFQYGTVRVLLKHPIVIQGGFNGEEHEIEVSPLLKEGGETLEDVQPEPVVKGMKVLTPHIQEQAKWPEALIESFNAAKKNKETKASVKIEMAGTECYEIPGCLDTEDLLEKSGPAFILSLKVTVQSPWLESLGGGPCTIGSNEHPIKQFLTDEGAGSIEAVEFNKTFSNIMVRNSELVDLSWKIEPESGPKGCGGPYEEYVDNALRKALYMQYSDQRGFTWLRGDLFSAFTNNVRHYGVEETGELP
jgi:hypothetical protein